jgi:peptide/nickel transport system permease protein
MVTPVDYIAPAEGKNKLSGDEEREIGQRRWKYMKEVFTANPSFTIALFIFIGMIAVIFIWAAIEPNWQFMYKDSNGIPLWDEPASPDHPLGTTHQGYDSLVCLINAAKNSLIIGFASAGIAVPIAVVVGTFGAYKAGALDSFLTGVTSIFLVIPVISIYMIIAANVAATPGGGQSIGFIIVIIGLVIWPWAARSIRSQVLSLKEREFVHLARITGQKGSSIAIIEILPNMLSYIILVFFIEVVVGITTEAGLTTIGISNPGNNITLGLMLQWGLWFEVTSGDLLQWIPAGIVLLILVMMMYILQGTMPQLFNPRLRER